MSKKIKDMVKNNNPDIICTWDKPYFPSYFLGEVKERYIKTIDYMVGMDDFKNVFEELCIDGNCFKRESKIYDVLDADVLKKVGGLGNDDIDQIGEFTNRVESSELYSTIGFDVYVLKHLQQYHIKDMLKDIEEGLIHKFIELNYQKTNLIIHLFPSKYMEAKNVSYSDALSYCISIMWATLINIVARKAQEIDIIDLLKQVFHDFNPILTKMEIYTKRELTSNGFSFMQELEQLTAADKFIDIKTSVNRVSVRWTPRSDRFENYIYKFYRTQTNDWEDEKLEDLRGDNNGKRFCKFECRIKDSTLITKITIVGQNIMRDVTGYYTTPIYGLLCDKEQLEHYELSSLFTVLTGTKEHNDLFKHALMKSYMYVRANSSLSFKSNLEEDSVDGLWDSSNSEEEIGNNIASKPTSDSETTRKPKLIRPKQLSELSIFKSDKKDYSANMVSSAVNSINKKVFCDLKLNNDYCLATQLIEKFNMKRNVPKDIMTVLKIADLTEQEAEEALKLIERHKRPRIEEMVEYVRMLETPKSVLNELYNFLWMEKYI